MENVEGILSLPTSQRSLSQNIACSKSQETALPSGSAFCTVTEPLEGTENQRKLSKVGERKQGYKIVANNIELFNQSAFKSKYWCFTGLLIYILM